jgi:hypothetical protein
MVILLIIASYNEVPILITGGIDEASADPTSLRAPKHTEY